MCANAFAAIKKVIVDGIQIAKAEVCLIVVFAKARTKR
jgi:hypothetical protein